MKTSHFLIVKLWRISAKFAHKMRFYCHMINRILHSCSCIIEFINLVGENCKMLVKALSFTPTRLMNSIIREHSCKILYFHCHYPLCLFLLEHLFASLSLVAISGKRAVLLAFRLCCVYLIPFLVFLSLSHWFVEQDLGFDCISSWSVSVRRTWDRTSKCISGNWPIRMLLWFANCDA